MRWNRKVSVACLVIASLFLPRWGDTCGPFIPQAVFVRPHGPDRPMPSFAQGRLGIVLPRWHRAYLVIAYRYFEAKPLSAAEQRSLLEHWDIDRRLPIPDQMGQAYMTWVAARNRYAQRPQEEIPRTFEPNPTRYYEIPNCQPPAFMTAAETLKKRVHRYGAANPDVQEWIHGQDAVFHNCVAGGHSTPPALPASAAAWLRADRAYQIAAATFYLRNYDTAAQAFRAISQDQSSPWHAIAAYCVARSLIRRAQQTIDPKQTYDPVVLAEADAWLRRLIRDPKEKVIRQDAEALLGFVAYRLHPDQRKSELAQVISRGETGARFSQFLRDYTLLLDRILDVEPEFSGVQMWTPEYSKLKQEWTLRRYSELKAQRADDLSDWLITMQSNAPAAREHAFKRWRATHSAPWLVAALGKLNEGESGPEDLMKAAARTPPGSTAYLTVLYHRARLARGVGNYPEARHILEDASVARDKLPPSAAHLLQDEQMMASANFEHFQSQLCQTPLRVDFGEEMPDTDQVCYDADCNLTFYGSTKPPKNTPLLPQFSPAAASVLNTQVPVSVFIKVAKSSSLPENLRRRMAPAAWARAAFLNEFELASSVTDAAIAAHPELEPYLAAYLRATTPQERQFAAAFATLHFAGLRPLVDDSYPRTTRFQKIDEYRDNWWCMDVGESVECAFVKSYREYSAEKNALIPGVSFPAFLDAADREQATKERQELRSFGIAAKYLPRIVIEWANQHPEDARVPEALHLAVRASRYGCSDGKPNKLSRQAFTILHKNYPVSEWAKKTPFWYQ